MTLWGYKIAGGGLLLASAIFYGFFMVKKERVKVAELVSFRDFVRFISDNIEHRMIPIPDIVRECTIETLSHIGFLSSACQYGIMTAWEKGTWEMDGEAREVLGTFFLKIGRGYREDELDLCRYTIKRLEGILEKVQGDIKNKEKMYRTVPLMLALSVMLILL